MDAVHDETPQATEEASGLDDLINEWEAEQADAEAQANAPDPEDLEKARVLAEKINGGFLWAVNRTQCPHVELKHLVDPDQGAEAFLPLAEKMGGEVPPWLAALDPYIKAGTYMGMTIVTARQAEAQALKLLEEQEKQGGQDGHQSESRPG